MKRPVSWVLFALYAALVLELGSRTYWWAVGHGPFLGTAKALAYAALFPEVHAIEAVDVRQDDDFFDVLLLGGSVLTPEYGDVPRALHEALTYALKRPVRVHTAAAGAQTSRDSYLKYAWLSGKRFDAVVVYHAINETRANNCPPAVFEPDYSHYAWYRFLNDLERHPSLRASTALLSLDLARIHLLGALGALQLVPTHQPRPEWLSYGADIKTSASFRGNIQKIVAIARERSEPLVLVTFAYHVPSDYTQERFLAKNLDYTLHDKPVEMWGLPTNVVGGILAHNRVTREVAQASPGVTLVDEEALLPKSGAYFNDICHFTYLGTEAFVRNLLEPLVVLHDDRAHSSK
jgi:hypothetical protein